jgi:Flp pilus assembly protein TadG
MMPCQALKLRNLRQFRRSERGSAAVEFALVAPVFFALLFAILEASITFLAGQVLESINQEGARMVMTGQAQSSYSQTQFANYVCNAVPAGLFNCNNIAVDVRSYHSFSNVSLDCSTAYSNGSFQYSPGGPGDIVVVRLFYPWQLFVTGLGWNPSNLSGNKQLLCATAVFKNEPY